MPEECWPGQDFTCSDLPEVKKSIVLTASQKTSWNDLWNRFSSWKRMIRVMAYCLRFINKTSRRLQVNEGLTPEELTAASKKICLLIQKEEFSNEIKELNKNGNIPNGSKLLRLSPIIKEDLLRVGGRIGRASISYDQQHPILLPKDHPVTNLIIRSTHEKFMHAGVNGTLYAVREKFWPIDGRLCVRKIVNNCIKCFRK